VNGRASRWSRAAGACAAAALAAVLAAACAGPHDVAAVPEKQGAAPAQLQSPAGNASAGDSVGPASAGDAAGSASAGDPGPASAGKPVAPFSIRYQILGAPAVGQPLEVRITVRPSIPMTDLELEAAGDASLDVAASDAKQSAPSATREAPAEWSVSVVPRDVGTLQLKITVDGIIDGNRQARSLVVPIRLQGQAPVKPEASTQAGPKPDDAEAHGQAEQGGEALIHLHSDR
jgi:hypothetical protein